MPSKTRSRRRTIKIKTPFMYQIYSAIPYTSLLHSKYCCPYCLKDTHLQVVHRNGLEEMLTWKISCQKYICNICEWRGLIRDSAK